MLVHKFKIKFEIFKSIFEIHILTWGFINPGFEIRFQGVALHTLIIRNLGEKLELGSFVALWFENPFWVLEFWWKRGIRDFVMVLIGLGWFWILKMHWGSYIGWKDKFSPNLIRKKWIFMLGRFSPCRKSPMRRLTSGLLSWPLPYAIQCAAGMMP